MSAARFPLASLCIEDAERFLGERFVKQHSQDNIISAMENVALGIDLGDTLTLAWEMVKEEVSR